jgi:hypothetical protein
MTEGIFKSDVNHHESQCVLQLQESQTSIGSGSTLKLEQQICAFSICFRHTQRMDALEKEPRNYGT